MGVVIEGRIISLMSTSEVDKCLVIECNVHSIVTRKKKKSSYARRASSPIRKKMKESIHKKKEESDWSDELDSQ